MRTLAVMLLLLLVSAVPAHAGHGWFEELPVPRDGGPPGGPGDGSRGKDVTIGPDGAIWWTTRPGGHIARMPPSGGGAVFSRIDEFDMVEAGTGITAGPDGNVWFAVTPRVTTRESGGVGRITPAGAVTLFRIPAAEDAAPVSVNAIVFATDGRLYASTTNGIGVFTEQAGWSFLAERPQCGAGPADLAAGADGAVWYIVNGTCFEIGRIRPDGDVEPGPTTLSSFPIQVAVADDGVVWATLRAGNVGRFDPRTGAYTEVSLPRSAQPEPWGIAASPGSNPRVWVTDLGGAVWRIDGNGRGLLRLDEGDGLRRDARPRTIVPGPQEALWFGISGAFPPAIGRLIPPRCTVPNLRGSSRRGAKRRLLGAHCRLGRVSGRGRVRSQRPRAGRLLPERGRVSIRLG